MSIAVLNQVYDETRRLAIAGSNLAKDDFRLTKLIEPLEKSAAKAPVFGQIAKLVKSLIDSPEKKAPQALLDLSSLVTAVLYTQGETDAQGGLKSIESTQVDVQTTQTSARMLKPLIEALTTTGSGRLKTIQEAHEIGAFNDLRLVNYAVKAIDDKYSEIGEYVAEKVLPTFGKAIVPLVEEKIDIKGSRGSARRLKLLYHLDAKAARPIVLEAFENGNKDMRIAALSCLGDEIEDLPHLHEQAKAKSKDVRAIAYERLAKFKDTETNELFSKAILSADLNIVAGPISRSPSTKLVNLALKHSRESLAAIPDAKPEKKQKAELSRLDELLECFVGRKEKPVIQFLADTFENRSRLFPDKKSSAALVDEIESRLCEVMLSTCDPKHLKLLADAHADLGPRGFQCSLYAARIVLKPGEVYKRFAKYYLANPKDKANRGAEDRKSMVRGQLDDRYGYYYSGYAYYGYREHFGTGFAEKIKKAKWDSKWLDAAIDQDHLEIVSSLADQKNKKIKTYVEDRLRRELKKRDPSEVAEAVDLAIKCQHPKAADMLVEVLEKQAKKQSGYVAYWIAPLISKLGAKSYNKVEKAVASLPDNIVDVVMPHLQTLKSKKK